jgi:hypothetical protein
MTDQHDQHDLLSQRERQFEIDRITFQYVTEYRAGRAPRIEDYVRQYPEYAGELLEYALYFHTTGVDSEPLTEPDELQISPAAEKALARIREQRAAYAPTSAGISSLVQHGIQLNIAPPRLAETLGISSDLLGKLEARAIIAASIPRTLLQRLAETLKTTPEAILAYLRGAEASQSPGFFYADQPPEQQQETFLDAVQTSALSPERKREWAEIVNADTQPNS